MAVDEQARLYQISPDRGNLFVTGYLPDGRQVLTGFYQDGIKTVTFDAEGNVLHQQDDEIPPGLGGYRSPEASQTLAFIESSFGFQRSPIRVKQFALTDETIDERMRWHHTGVGISEYPELFNDIRDRPEAHGVETCQRLGEMVKWWEDEGKYVLCWMNDFWMSRSGEITDT
jgi:hypothetical protein